MAQNITISIILSRIVREEMDAVSTKLITAFVLITYMHTNSRETINVAFPT